LTEQGRYAAGSEAFFQKSLNLLILSNDAELFRGNRQILYQIEFDHARGGIGRSFEGRKNPA
jgi:hypothetical protein